MLSSMFNFDMVVVVFRAQSTLRPVVQPTCKIRFNACNCFRSFLSFFILFVASCSILPR